MVAKNHPCVERLVKRRSANIHNNQKRRAKALGRQLDYDLECLRRIINDALHAPCPYCGETLTADNFSADHKEPTSRDGAHAIDNIVICCKRCNEIKGPLNDHEYRLLLTVLAAIHPVAKKSVCARLRAGARFVKS